MPNITIVDVAREAGVSTATVSMVLRDKGRISKATRQIVLEKIDSLGYIYNQTAANLRSQRSSQIGLLLHDITNPFYSEMTAGLSREVERQGHMLLLTNGEESIDRQKKFIESLMSHNAGGLVLCPALNTPDSFLNSLKRRQIPVVLAVRPVPSVEFDYVGTDNFYGAQLATQHLINLGHKKIAFIGGRQGSQTRSQRFGGYIGKLSEHKLFPRQEWIVNCEATRSAGAKAMNLLLEKAPEVTAVVCFQDIIAFGVMRALRVRNIRVGSDIAVVGFDNIEEASDTAPELTTISVSAAEIGRKAGELLLSRTSGNDAPVKKVIINPRLIIRESCGATHTAADTNIDV